MFNLFTHLGLRLSVCVCVCGCVCACVYMCVCSCTYVYVRVSASVQFSHPSMCNFLWSQGLPHARLPCPSPTPRACSNSCPYISFSKSISLWFNLHIRNYIHLEYRIQWALTDAYTHKTTASINTEYFHVPGFLMPLLHFLGERLKE